MPRNRKAKDLSATGDSTPRTDDEESQDRPSQLDQIRAALAESPSSRSEEPDELPGPEAEAELPAHVEEPAAEAVAEPAAETEAPAPEEPAAEVAEPAAEAAEPETEPEKPAEPRHPAAVTTPPPTSAWVPPPNYPPVAAAAMRSFTPSSSLALGVVLVVVGIFFLLMRLFNVDLSTYGWPLYVIIPGVTLLVVGFVTFGTGALVPGGIITMIGLILAYQNATSDWASWAFAWTLVAPGGVGLGIFLQGLRVRDWKQVRLGRNLMFWALLLFMIGFTVFESIFDISNFDYGIVGRAALPVLLIVIGVTLLARSVQRGRSA